MNIRDIRNFAIVAHIDHGKTTLSDRIIELTGSIHQRLKAEQLLDSMELEREKGITIKAQTVRLTYHAENGQDYILNLIDTPGHVDFSYEVSRSLTACEGVVLLVDATQGVEAQTLANVYQAMELDLPILPVLNKIDLPASDVSTVSKQIEQLIGLSTENILCISAKTGQGVVHLLESIIKNLPAPLPSKHEYFQALLVDAWYDVYVGVIMLVRVFSGTITTSDRIMMKSTGMTYPVDSVGYLLALKKEPAQALHEGELGYVLAGNKSIGDCHVGDTLVLDKNDSVPALPGFRASVPFVFCSFFSTDSESFDLLRKALEKLSLNDSSFQFEPTSTLALGMGFHCGFLGLLHMEIIRERLEREYNLDLTTTAPSVKYQLILNNGSKIDLDNPADMPDPTFIKEILEPWVKISILVPHDSLGSVIQLCIDRRGVQQSLSYVENRVYLIFDLPLNEMIFNFYDRLKSITHGYASLDYERLGMFSGDLVKVNIYLNKENVEPFSFIAHRSVSVVRGRKMCDQLKTLIPRQLFPIPIQAMIGKNVIARSTISALRKDVTSKCYGGDFTRKRKLLDKQKAGKKRMRQFGKVSVPKNIFLNALKWEDDA